jgi:hypothetical protein
MTFEPGSGPHLRDEDARQWFMSAFRGGGAALDIYLPLIQGVFPDLAVNASAVAQPDSGRLRDLVLEVGGPVDDNELWERVAFLYMLVEGELQVRRTRQERRDWLNLRRAADRVAVVLVDGPRDLRAVFDSALRLAES